METLDEFLARLPEWFRTWLCDEDETKPTQQNGRPGRVCSDTD